MKTSIVQPTIFQSTQPQVIQPKIVAPIQPQIIILTPLQTRGAKQPITIMMRLKVH